MIIIQHRSLSVCVCGGGSLVLSGYCLHIIKVVVK